MASFTRLKSGWRAQVKVKGNRRTKVFPNKVQAQDWARRTEQDMHDSQISGFISADGETILSILIRYEREKGADWSRAKSDAVRRLKSDMTLKADELSPMAVRDWAVGRRYGLGTTRIDLRTLQGCLKHAKIAWFMDVNLDAVSTAISSLERSGDMPEVAERDRRVTPEEEKLLRENWTSNKVTPDVVPFLIDTPIRSGEMCGLTRNDIDGRIITIRDRKDPQQKNRVDRVPLLGRSYEILAAQTTLAPFPYEQYDVGEAVRQAGRKAGLEDLRAHDLRHEGISRLFDAGWTIPQVSLVSGHKDWNTLKRYTHISAESLLEL